MGTDVRVADEQSEMSSGMVFTWDEVHQHNTREDMWIVVDNNVYDVTHWQKKHPGGARILGHFAGQDATEAWYAFHNHREYVGKYLSTMMVGRLKETQDTDKISSLRSDFKELRETVEKMDMFKVDPWFFIAHLGHIVLLEILAVLVSHYFGATWYSFLLTVLLLVTCQAQIGWTQHDYGHQSVFNESRLNHLVQFITMSFMKAGGSHWWNFRHFQHHAKPNVFKKDPDVTVPHLFLPGDHVPEKWGRQKRGIAPYQHQHLYFWFLGPMSLMPVYFHLEIMYFTLKRRDWIDMFCIAGFGLKWLAEFYSVWGFIGSGVLYMTVRVIESFWFVFVTQMSHIPMELDEERNRDWVTAQTISSTNVTPGFFHDWFTGHLNYQIEHHLFPTMPRHNFYKVAPLVKSLCHKHSLPYTVKPLFTAFKDIIRSLEKSGQIWYDAYYHL